MLLRTIGSGSGSASSIVRLSTTRITDLIVISARWEPMQCREPPPNGTQTLELGFGSSRKRSGWNRSGSGKTSASWWIR